MSMTPIPLTASQIREMDETGFDKEANDKTLLVAVGFHSNRAHELAKQERKWWDALAEIHGLDIRNQNYTVRKVAGEVAIVEVTNG